MTKESSKLKSPQVLGSVGIAVLFVAIGSYLAATIIDLNSHKSDVSAKPKLVAPLVVQKSLKSANDVAMKEYDLHNSAAAALNEKQVKLVKD